jgi:hypothetical protein
MADVKLQLLESVLPFQVAGNRVLAAGTKGAVIRTAAAGTQQPAAVKPNALPTKQIAIATPTATAVQQKGASDVAHSPTKPPQQHIMIRQQIAGTQVVQKVAAQPGTVVVSGGQMFAPGQIVVSTNQVVGSPTQVGFLNIWRRVLWRMVRPQREEVNRRLKKLRNEFHSLCSSPHIVKVIRSAR